MILKMKNDNILEIWAQLEDVLFIENTKGELELVRDFQHFEKGTTQFEIWHWFDEKLPNGVHQLLN